MCKTGTGAESPAGDGVEQAATVTKPAVFCVGGLERRLQWELAALGRELENRRPENEQSGETVRLPA
ncbi:unnamed protein product [Linum trigynum]|uniref:Uncharacterized protein n=1 Tax=Linum trigynum TaxID=586398 RepID=A0AAV2F9J3_9ROSI